MSVQREPKPGDVIWADRIAKGLPYNHCGIYKGGGYVIHFAAPDGAEISQENAVIHLTTLEHFKDGCPLKIVEFPEEPGKTVYSAEETLRNAESRLGEKGYNFATNNCDHFATWCKTGEHRSLQADELKTVIRATGGDLGELVCAVHDCAEGFRKYQFEERENLKKTAGEINNRLELNSGIADAAPPTEPDDNNAVDADYEVIDPGLSREAETVLLPDSGEPPDAVPMPDNEAEAAETENDEDDSGEPPEKKPWYERVGNVIKKLTFPIAAGLEIAKRIFPPLRWLPSPRRIGQVVRNGIDKVVGFVKVVAGVFTPSQALQEARENQTALLGEVISAKQTQPVRQVVKQVFGRIGTAVKHIAQTAIQRIVPAPVRTIIKTGFQKVGRAVVSGIKTFAQKAGNWVKTGLKKLTGIFRH